MPKPILSVIIPTYNNDLIYEHLALYAPGRQLALQKTFEVIVVNDAGRKVTHEGPGPDNLRIFNLEENGGPAKARNFGADKAKGERLLFVGDDCLPSARLVLGHIIHHTLHPGIALQGYSPFHPDIMDTKFMHWLDKSGMQANWKSAKTPDGKGWRKETNGFLLTTNWSISKGDFWAFDGFPTEFPNAAWEDIALGHHLSKSGYKTHFSSQAVNFHWHKHDVRSFMARQRKEGYSRVELATIFPEFAPSLTNPADLRGSANVEIEELAARVLEKEHIPGADYSQAAQALMLACSFQGVRDFIEEEGGVLQALPHVTHEEFPAFIMTARKGIKEGIWGYVEHCIAWAIQKEKSNWAAWAFVGECYEAVGKPVEALDAYRTAVEINPAAEWPLGRYTELRSIADGTLSIEA